jgi:nitrogen regulatory protein PII
MRVFRWGVATLIKKIEALIKPSDLNELKRALQEENLLGVSIITIKSLDEQAQHTELYRGA